LNSYHDHIPDDTGSLASMPEDSLVASAKLGTHAPYIELCRRHSKMVSRAVYRITRNEQDAEDALQESLLRAFTHIKTFDGRSAFSTWLTSIARNCALMAIRRRRSRPEVSLDSEMDGITWQSDHVMCQSANPEEELCEREKAFILRRAVRRLPPVLRGVTELRHFQDASVKEVATRMDLSVPATKSRLRRARTELASSLARHEFSRMDQSQSAHQ
jgi:RNA polymerase sigma-70 factor, ECF subfamily